MARHRLKALGAIEHEFSPKFEAVEAQLAALEAEIKQEVISGGATVKGQHFMAVWNKGRVTWDAKLLEGFTLAHPELEKARKVGEPTCTLRKVG